MDGRKRQYKCVCFFLPFNMKDKKREESNQPNYRSPDDLLFTSHMAGSSLHPNLSFYSCAFKQNKRDGFLSCQGNSALPNSTAPSRYEQGTANKKRERERKGKKKKNPLEIHTSCGILIGRKYRF